ncbi:unnamed protein product [Camellia sinensis]
MKCEYVCQAKNLCWESNKTNGLETRPKLEQLKKLEVGSPAATGFGLDQLLLGSGIGKSPAPAAPLGGENPKNFCKLVRILIEHRKYKNAIEQSVGSSPCKPLWLIFWTIRAGTKGSFATALPSKREFKRPKTTKRTRATTAPDLNLKRERSRLDSLRLDSTRSIFLVLDFLRLSLEGFESVFMVSSFFEALSMEDLRDLYEVVR